MSRDERTPAVRVLRPLQDFLRTEAAAGVLLLVMVPVALIWANGPFGDSYDSVWSTRLTVGIGKHDFGLDLRHWVNDGLMALFFFVVGLEIKRELVDGDLRDRRKAMTPALAAIGGMVAPALIFVAFNLGGHGARGWGIPMATDIAIVLGVLVVAGERVPNTLKTFLLTLAMVDDIGAIAVIALFYPAHTLDVVALASAVAVLALVYLCVRLGVRQPVPYVVLALVAWAATYASGVHATLVGVALAMLTSGRAARDADAVDAGELADVSDYEAASQTATLARATVSSVEWLQHVFHPWSSYMVLPLFALANAGVAITGSSLSDALGSPVSLGVASGLLLGKPIGICLFTWLAVRVAGARLPSGVRFADVAAASVLAGIGFTVSLFITDSAFSDAELVNQAKVGVLAASFVAGLAGFAALHLSARRRGSSRRRVD